MVLVLKNSLGLSRAEACWQLARLATARAQGLVAGLKLGSRALSREPGRKADSFLAGELVLFVFFLFNRPGVAGAVLQSHPSLIH